MRIFDLNTKPITLEVWVRLIEDRDYSSVARDALPNGILVSTVWLGIDHSIRGTGIPIIFETMVFRTHHGGEPLAQTRYSTKEQALAGHDQMLATWRDKELPSGRRKEEQ